MPDEVLFVNGTPLIVVECKRPDRGDALLGGPRAEGFRERRGISLPGRSHRLLLVDDAPAPVRLVRGRLELRRDGLADASGHLVRWYTGRGRDWLPRRVEPWAERMRATVTDLRVLPLGYRWGSCTMRGRVNVHWAAMQLPPTLVDYVLVHELAHLSRPDHGPKFWALVERSMPDYPARRERLRRFGPDLWLPGRPS